MKTIYGIGPSTRISTGIRSVGTPVYIPPPRKPTARELELIRARRRVCLEQAQLAVRTTEHVPSVGLDPRVVAGIIICYAIALLTCATLF
jgi:hypothetical protein